MFENEFNFLAKTAPPVILCVGSDKIAGDSLGPTVGSLLTELYNVRCFVYGVSGRTVNGKNLTEYTDFIKAVHPNSALITVDACVSDCAPVGKIKIIRGGINPRRAVTNAAKPVGDVGILGVVEKPSDDTLSTLMTVSPDNVLKLSYKIAFLIFAALSFSFNPREYIS